MQKNKIHRPLMCAICGQAPATRRINGVPACKKRAHNIHGQANIEILQTKQRRIRGADKKDRAGMGEALKGWLRGVTLKGEENGKSTG